MEIQKTMIYSSRQVREIQEIEIPSINDPSAKDSSNRLIPPRIATFSLENGMFVAAQYKNRGVRIYKRPFLELLPCPLAALANACDFRPSQTTYEVCLVSDTKIVRVDLYLGLVLETITDTVPATTVVGYSLDGCYLIAGNSAGVVSVWQINDTPGGRSVLLLRKAAVSGCIVKLALSSNNQFLLLTDSKARVFALGLDLNWSEGFATQILDNQNFECYAFDWHPWQHVAALAGWGGRVHIDGQGPNLPPDGLLLETSVGKVVSHVSYMEDGEVFVVASSREIELFDATSFNSLRRWTVQSGKILALQRNGDVLLVAKSAL